jgi:serine/threonine protein kinase
MEIFCTRPNCHSPKNHIESLESLQQSSPPQRYCVSCGMNLVLSERYVPLQLLGSGAFGVTFLARDLRTLERKCIVKQLRPQSVLKSDQISAVENLFRRESAILEQLGDVSTQIPTLFDSFVLPVSNTMPGEPKEIFYLVQQYIDGHDLAVELKQKGAFSQEDILDLLYQILPVLDLVHENGAIHRDVKPANIMRAKNGLMYLIDFGAVKQIMSGATNTNNQSIVIGTEGYAPLEQMSGRAVYPSTDLYALAISSITLMGNIKPNENHFPEFMDSWRDQVTIDSSLADILDRMIRSKPTERYQSVAEVFDALHISQLFPPITQRPRLSSGGTQPLAYEGSTIGRIPSSQQVPSSPAVSQPVAMPAASEQFQAEGSMTSLGETADLMKVVRRSVITGSGSSLLAAGFISFLSTIWLSSILWVVILGGMLFYRYRNSFTTWQMLGAAIAANGLVLMLYPTIGSLLKSGPAGIGILLLVAVLTGTIFFIVAVLIHLAYRSMSR